MQKTTQRNTPAALLALTGLLGLAGFAIADTPEVLDHVPSSAAAVVTINNVSELMQDITRINAALGDKGNPMLPMMMGMMGGMPGMNLDGSIAVVVNIDPEAGDFTEFDDSSVMIILPVSDFDTLVQATGGKVTNGIAMISMQGQQLALKSVGPGYAVAGSSVDAVAEFNGAAGQMGAFEAMLGVNGTEAVSGNDISIIVNMAVIRPLIEPQIGEMMEQAEMMMDTVPDAPQGLPMGEIQQGLEQVVREMSVSVLSLSADDLGLGFGYTAQFNAESELANFFNHEGNAHDLLGRVPAGPYLFAGAMDFEWAGVGTVLEFANAMVEQLKESQPEGMDFMGKMDMMTLLENATGYAQVVSVNPEGMQAGLFKNSVTYIAGKDPAGIAAFQKEASLAADGVVAGGIAISATYEENATTIDGVELDSYSSIFSADQNSMMGGASPAMFMQMLFGADMGPKGYLGTLEHGVFQTTTQDEAYVSSAISSAKTGKGLGTEKDITEIGNQLPSSRFFEMFIGTDHLYNNVGPMLAMFGMLDAFEPAEDMAPIAIGISGHSGGFNFGAFIPLDVISIAADLAPDEPGMSEPADEDPEF